MADAGAQHRTLPSNEAVKLEAVARLLRQALRLAEGAEASAQERAAIVSPPAPPPPATPAAPPSPISTSAPSTTPVVTDGSPVTDVLGARTSGGDAGRTGAGGPPQVGYLLGLLQTEQTRMDETKKEVARKDAELSLKLQFAKKKEEDLEVREGELKKLDAQLRVREMQITRREERMREMGRMGPAE